ncbi:MAG TPA: hypothetical protein VM370_06075 [Candidatus Thermoplasmatota archaeon]|nr:hypothetical protein [Candidatus Thermoplasmatota archaeon]
MARPIALALALVLLGLAPPASRADADRGGDACDTPAMISFLDGAHCERPAARSALTTLAAKTLMGTNADGTRWRVTYETGQYASEAEADAYAQMQLVAAMRAYANETAWGFASHDPDGILDVTLDGCDCIYASAEADIHLFPRPNDILPLLPGLAYRSESEMIEIIVGHELFHHMQFGLQQWRLGNWLVEGMARASETANVPDGTFLPTTLTYRRDDNGMNGFVNAPSRTIAQHSYDWSIVWGYLYAHEGGVALWKAVLEETATASGDANVAGPAAIQRAMDRVPGGEHATFAEAYAAFAEALVTHAGWTWGAPDGTGAHDWSTYFVALGRTNGAVLVYYTIPAWGIRFHDARPAAPGGDSTLAYAGQPFIRARLYTHAGGAAAMRDAEPMNAISGVDDAALLLVRTSVELQDGGGVYGIYSVIVRR